MKVIVNAEKCVHCGKCASDCVSHALVMRGSEPVPAAFAEKLCIGCGHCMAVCPSGALSLNGIDPLSLCAFGPLPEPDAMKNLLGRRRSCRAYKKERVPEQKMKMLKEILDFAPSGRNARKIAFSFVETESVMEEFRAEANAGMLEAVSGGGLPPQLKEFRLMRRELESGADVVFRGATHFVAASYDPAEPSSRIDGIIALAQFEMMAQCLGIGTLWNGFAVAVFEFFAPRLKFRLQYPQGYDTAFVMAFGVPDVVYPRSVRPEPYAKHTVA